MRQNNTASSLQWIAIVILAALTVVLGCIGFTALNPSLGFLEVLYRTVSLFTFNSGAIDGTVPLTLEFARWLAPLVLVILTIKAFFLFAQEQITQLRLRFYRNHVVLCGLGKKGARLARAFLDQNMRLVVIESNENNESISLLREQGALVLVGDAADPVHLRRARIALARYLIVITGDNNTNVEIAVRAFEGTQNRLKHTLQCFVHIFNPTLQKHFRSHEVFTRTDDPFEARIFNIYEIGARIIFGEYSPDKYGLANAEDQTPLHVLILGFGWMGQSLLLQAARIGHYANGKKLRVTIVDRNINEIIRQFRFNYPAIDELVELSLNSMDARYMSDESISELENAIPFTVIYVCLGAEICGIDAATNFRKHYVSDSPVIICMLPQTGLAALIEKGGILPKTANIMTFNIVDKTCVVHEVIEEKLDELARAIHELWCERQVQKGLTEALHPNLVPWERLNEEIRESNRQQADHIPIKLRAVGYEVSKDGYFEQDVRNVLKDKADLLAKMEHCRYVAEKRLAGWKWGEDRNPIEKTNPNLKPWDRLEEEMREENKAEILCITDELKRVGWGIKKR